MNSTCKSYERKVNRLIHSEVLDAWYENEDAIYQIYISRRSICFLGHTIDIDSEIILPRMLRRVKSLEIQMSGIPLRGDFDPFNESRHRDYHREHPSGQLRFLASVVDMLQPGRCSLQNFKLEIMATIPFCVECWGDEERSRQALELSTFMFLGMRGRLKTVEAALSLGESVLRNLLATDRRWKEEWAARMRPLLDNFEEQMIDQSMALL
ncbi:hypothetical protein DL98DRAFT_529099 [Cadophora sp. DSE1049]|nr:hypothetical protein DL98DRAFT_529099 [Cadophora sp. DSE1049]